MSKYVYEVIVINDKTNDITYTSVSGKSYYDCKHLAESLYKKKGVRVNMGSCLKEG
jgi:hypothetical protein